jgi:hypothetical protein
MNFDSVTHYLRQDNPRLARHMQLILPATCSLEALREMAVLMHQRMTVTSVHALWIVYRQSGTGELPSTVLSAYRGDRRVWPLAVQSLMKQWAEPSVDEEGTCLRFVEHVLHHLHEQEQQWQWQLSTKAQTVSGYTRIIEYALEKFVKQGLESFHVEMDRQMASIRYEYNDTLLQRAYLAESTDHSQVS